MPDMSSNHFEIEINAPVEKVWEALTNANEFGKWMKTVTVQTDWKLGSEITYTCLDENGNVVQWEGIEMIWNGVIQVFEVNKEFTCTYPSKSTGLVDESYFLENLGHNRTKLTQVQTLISQEVAEGYKDGTAETLQYLKGFLEN